MNKLYTKKLIMSLYNENEIVISNDAWNRGVGFGLLPLGNRSPTGKRGGKEKFYPDNILGQIDTILDLEERQWPRQILIVTLFVLGYEVDWDKLRLYFHDYLSAFERGIRNDLPE
jgi:hypothetical protein